jgi:hypothetical protein
MIVIIIFKVNFKQFIYKQVEICLKSPDPHTLLRYLVFFNHQNIMLNHSQNSFIANL